MLPEIPSRMKVWVAWEPRESCPFLIFYLCIYLFILIFLVVENNFSFLYTGKHAHLLRSTHTLAIKYPCQSAHQPPHPLCCSKWPLILKLWPQVRSSTWPILHPSTFWGHWRNSGALLPTKIIHFLCDRSPCQKRTTWRNSDFFTDFWRLSVWHF